jgi:hypothetical protein
MNSLDHLIPLIDNGGQRFYIKRRCNFRLRVLTERMTNLERRKIADRRKILNQRRMNGPERRNTFLN